jgi:hypothetical protein
VAPDEAGTCSDDGDCDGTRTCSKDGTCE